MPTERLGMRHVKPLDRAEKHMKSGAFWARVDLTLWCDQSEGQRPRQGGARPH